MAFCQLVSTLQHIYLNAGKFLRFFPFSSLSCLPFFDFISFFFVSLFFFLSCAFVIFYVFSCVSAGSYTVWIKTSFQSCWTYQFILSRLISLCLPVNARIESSTWNASFVQQIISCMYSSSCTRSLF